MSTVLLPPPPTSLKQSYTTSNAMFPKQFARLSYRVQLVQFRFYPFGEAPPVMQSVFTVYPMPRGMLERICQYKYKRDSEYRSGFVLSQYQAISQLCWQRFIILDKGPTCHSELQSKNFKQCKDKSSQCPQNVYFIFVRILLLSFCFKITSIVSKVVLNKIVSMLSHMSDSESSNVVAEWLVFHLLRQYL